MRILNEPIKVIATFYPDGKVEPIKFRLDDNVVYVQKVVKTYEEKTVGNKRLVFVCQHNNSDLYELKYELDSKVWYLFKK